MRFGLKNKVERHVPENIHDYTLHTVIICHGHPYLITDQEVTAAHKIQKLARSMLNMLYVRLFSVLNRGI